MRDLAAFLHVEITEGKLTELCEFLQFDKMKTNPSFAYRGVSDSIFRQGKSGKWREVFSQEQSDYIDEMYAGKIEELGLPVKYD